MLLHRIIEYVRAQNWTMNGAKVNMNKLNTRISLPALFVGILTLALMSCSSHVESPQTFIEEQAGNIEHAVARLEGESSNIQYSIWLGSPDGEAWYRHNADTLRPAASAIKTAILIEFFSEQANSLDMPFTELNGMIDNPLNPAISHFDLSQQAAVRSELRGLTARQLAEAMIHKKHIETNAAYNAAANVIIEYLGGPAKLTERVRHRFPRADGLQIARYMLADRQKNTDNLLTAESLSLLLIFLAKNTTDDALRDASRAVLLLERDVSRGDHYYKGGTLTSEPQVRIEAGWWDHNGGACIYVVIATRPVSGEKDFDEIRANLGELSKIVQDAGIHIRDILQALP